MNRRCI